LRGIRRIVDLLSTALQALSPCAPVVALKLCLHPDREREKFIIRQPPIGGKDDYHSENSWISDGLPSSSRRRRRSKGRGEGGEWRKKRSASGFDLEREKSLL